MKNILLIITPILCFALHPAWAAPTLKVGDPAPPLKVAKWFKGQPIEKLEPGSIYVVEFWATWCAPCKKNIPHLTELAKKFDGKARVIGVSIWESEKTDHAKRLAKVGQFVEEMGDTMDYFVAADDNDGFMGKNWMEAAQEGGIPTAFIVGRDAKIVWIGYPWQDMDQRLAETVAGTLDTKAIQAEAAKRQQDKDAKAQVRDWLKPVSDLQSAGKHPEAIAALDKAIADHPELADKTGYLRFSLLLADDEPAASRQARRLIEGELKDNYSALYRMTRDMAEPVKYKNLDWDVAIAAGKRAVELKPDDPSPLSALAHAYFRKGDFTQAIETGERAVKKAESSPDYPKVSTDYIKRMLERYKAEKQKAASSGAK
jgi:thiol-disulfide isomerase/thioredoxin